MPRKVNQYPTNRSIQKQAKLLQMQQKDLAVPPQHPAIQPITPTPVELVKREPVVIPTARPTTTGGRRTPLTRYLMIGITTFNRPKTLLRLLESLNNTVDEFTEKHLEVVIADDFSKPEHRKTVLDYISKHYGSKKKFPITYLYGSSRRGVAANKNRCIYSFLANPRAGELLLLDDDIVLQPNWWHYLTELSSQGSTGTFGSLPWRDATKPTLPFPQDSISLSDGPGKFQVTQTHAFGNVLWVNRDWLLKARYMNPQFRVYGYEHCMWSHRLNKANGFPMLDFYVAKESYRYWIIESTEESWRDNDEQIENSLKFNRNIYRRLLNEYSDKTPAEQLVADHEIPEFAVDWKGATRFGHRTFFRTATAPDVLCPTLDRHLETFQVKEVNHQWKSCKPDQYVTVVLGLRGLKRLENLQETLVSLYEGSTPVRVVLVEQDRFPFCRPYIESKVDDYIFTYSTGQYNRSWAFNTGSRLAQSDLLLLHDGDLLVPPDYLAKAVRELKATKSNASIPWGTIQYISQMSSARWPVDDPVLEKTFASNQNIRGGSLLIERKFFEEIHGMDENFWGWGGEDDVFYHVMTKLGKVHIPPPDKGSVLQHLWHPPGYHRESHEANLVHRNAILAMDAPKLRQHLNAEEPSGDPFKIRRTVPLRIKTASNHEPRRLHIIYDVEGWAYWHRAKALERHSPGHWKVTSSTIHQLPQNEILDVVLCLCYGQIDQAKAALQTRPTHLIGGFNVGWPRRLDHFHKLYEKCDQVLINNYDCWERLGQLPFTQNISNGVDGEVFRVKNTNIEQRKNRVLWLGSEYHAELKGWPNPLKEVQDKLKSKGITCDFKVVDPRSEKRLTHERLCDWYNGGGIYLCASTSEGTPNPLLESACCGVVPVTTPVGNVPELVKHKQNGFVVQDRTVDSFIEGIEFVVENFSAMQTAMLASIDSWKWPIRAKQYFDWFDALIEGKPYGLDAVLDDEQ